MGEYFSEDLYNLIMGKITAEDFRKTWGKVIYNASDCSINVGDNFISTYMD